MSEMPSPPITEVPDFSAADQGEPSVTDQGLHSRQISHSELALLKQQISQGESGPAPEQTEEAGQVEESRQARIFAPVVALRLTEQIPDMRALVRDEGPEYTVEDGAVRGHESDGRIEVTEESLQAADEWLKIATSRDPQLRTILMEGTPGVRTQPELAEALRENAALRQAVGAHFMDKMGKLMDIMPGQIRQNHGKTPNYKGYPENLKSREYAALLALSMLDGTFKEPSGSGALDDYDPHTDRGGGQHRYAARTLLDTKV